MRLVRSSGRTGAGAEAGTVKGCFEMVMVVMVVVVVMMMISGQ